MKGNHCDAFTIASAKVMLMMKMCFNTAQNEIVLSKLEFIEKNKNLYFFDLKISETKTLNL